MPEVQYSTVVTCKCESIYLDALTYGKRYDVLETDLDKNQLLIEGDNGRTRWFPSECFEMTTVELPRIASINFLDEITSPGQFCEINLEMSDGTKRWCYFVTPEHLAQSGDTLNGTDVRIHYASPHMVVVNHLTEDSVRLALDHIERQGQLLTCTLPRV